MKNLSTYLLFLLACFITTEAVAQKVTWHSSMHLNGVVPIVDNYEYQGYWRTDSELSGLGPRTLQDTLIILQDIDTTSTQEPYDVTNTRSFFDNHKARIISQLGFAGEVGVRRHIKGFSFSAGLGLELLRYKTKYEKEVSGKFEEYSRYETNTMLVYLNLPIDVYFSLTEKIKLKIGGSMDYLALTTKQQKGKKVSYENDMFNPLNITVRAGVEYKLVKNWSLFVDYRRKMLKTYGSDEFNYSRSEHGEQINLSAINIGVVLATN